MEDFNLKDAWNAMDKKIEESRILNLQSWALNLRWFETMQSLKARSTLESLAKFKIRSIALGIFWILFLAALMYLNQLQIKNIFFTVSIAMVILVTLPTVIITIKQVIVIRKLDYSDNIIETQKKLSWLQSSTIRFTAIAWLQMPFYSTFFWSSKWIINSGSSFWLIAFPITLLFVVLTIFLYRNISKENINKKWVKFLMMTGPEYKSVIRAKEFMGEIEDFKKELIF